MKKLFRAAYGDESRVLIILAKDLNEAISLANQSEIDRGTNDPYVFNVEDDEVFEVDLNAESQVLDNFSENYFF